MRTRKTAAPLLFPTADDGDALTARQHAFVTHLARGNGLAASCDHAGIDTDTGWRWRALPAVRDALQEQCRLRLAGLVPDAISALENQLHLPCENHNDYRLRHNAACEILAQVQRFQDTLPTRLLVRFSSPTPGMPCGDDQEGSGDGGTGGTGDAGETGATPTF